MLPALPVAAEVESEPSIVLGAEIGVVAGAEALGAGALAVLGALGGAGALGAAGALGVGVVLLVVLVEQKGQLMLLVVLVEQKGQLMQ